MRLSYIKYILLSKTLKGSLDSANKVLRRLKVPENSTKLNSNFTSFGSIASGGYHHKHLKRNLHKGSSQSPREYPYLPILARGVIFMINIMAILVRNVRETSHKFPFTFNIFNKEETAD